MLVGILAVPEGATASTGVVVIVGGPQYRAGSHRQFVLLSRALAAAGYPVLRFDYRGMGDSGGDLRDFADVSMDIASAINTLLTQVTSLRGVALWGLCDGASAALLYLHATQDIRVRGLCLLNPWVRSEASLAKTHVKHYYLQRLKQKEFWTKLARGGVAGKALAGLVRNLKVALAHRSILHNADAERPFQQRMAQAWMSFDGAIMLVLSGADYTATEFSDQISSSPEWRGALNMNRLRQHTVPDADHTFSRMELKAVVATHAKRLLEELNA